MSRVRNLLVAIAGLVTILMCSGFEGGFLILLILAGGFVYFLPSIIGSGTESDTGIFVLNLFLGWTAIGWVVALVWAVSSPNRSKQIKYFDYTCPKCGYKSKLDQQVRLFVCPQCRTETPFKIT